MVPVRMIAEGLDKKIDLFEEGMSDRPGAYHDSVQIEWIGDIQTVKITNYVAYKTYDWYNEDSGKLFIFENDLEAYIYELRIGENKISVKHTPMYAGGPPFAERDPIVMDAAAVLKDGRVYVPLRYIAEALGASAEWDGATRTVILTRI
jgi:hypothetical protein